MSYPVRLGNLLDQRTFKIPTNSLDVPFFPKSKKAALERWPWRLSELVLSAGEMGCSEPPWPGKGHSWL
jgi:hypothetical protein